MQLEITRDELKEAAQGLGRLIGGRHTLPVLGAVRFEADKSLQPTAYGYAHWTIFNIMADTRFDVAVKNKTPVIEQHRTRRDPDQFDRLIVLISRIDDMIAAEHFLPSEQGFYCNGCPFQAACKSWHREQARVTVRMAA